jgi:hypothetical protein
LTGVVASHGKSRNGYLKAGLGGLVTGLLTPAVQPLIDRINGSPGDLRIVLLAVPFAILVMILVRVYSANQWWAAPLAGMVTLIAFVFAINAAIWIGSQISDSEKVVRNTMSGLAGGFTGSGLMAIGMCLLPAGPRDPLAWVPMLVIGTCAGALLAVDNALSLDLVSVLYPVWQAGVAICLLMALQHPQTS